MPCGRRRPRGPLPPICRASRTRSWPASRTTGRPTTWCVFRSGARKCGAPIVARFRPRRVSRQRRASPRGGPSRPTLLADAGPLTTLEQIDFENHEGAVLQSGDTTVIWIDDDTPAVPQ